MPKQQKVFQVSIIPAICERPTALQTNIRMFAVNTKIWTRTVEVKDAGSL